MQQPPDITGDLFYEEDLTIMSQAVNYLDWQYSLIRPYIRGNVLEVGAGIGTFTRHLANDASSVTCVEPNRGCFSRLTGAVGQLPNVQLLEIMLEDLPRHVDRARRFDTVVCLNVLEHIQDDIAALRIFREMLSPDGRVVLLIPAVPFAYGPIDGRLGHYRRYSKRALRDAASRSGLFPLRLQYMNAVGLAGWIFNAKILRTQAQRTGQVRTFDRFIVPTLRRLEAIVPPPIGQSLMMVAGISPSPERKDSSTDDRYP